MKKLFRLAAVLVSSVLLVACATRSGFEPYVPAGKELKDLEPKTYQLTKVSLTLSGKPATSRYPDQAALEQVFADELRAALKQESLEGPRYGLRVSVNWERAMMGGSATEASDAFASAACAYESIIHDEKGDTMAVDAGDPLSSGSIGSDQKNLFNNLLRLKDSLLRTGTPESEMRELKRCATMLVERLPR